MEQQGMRVPVCLTGNRYLHCDAEIVGIYSVGAVVITRGGVNMFSEGAWSVRSAENGMTAATFYEKPVAHAFAEMLMREYGDISETLRRSFDYCETPEDKRLLDEIQQRSLHPSRVRRGMRIPYIKPRE